MFVSTADTPLGRASSPRWPWMFVFVLLALHVDRVFAQQRPAAPVKVAVVVEREIAAGQLFVATVLPLKRAVIGSAVDGRVIELLAEQGQRVRAKEPLAQLLTKTIELELDAAMAELELQIQELAELENGTRPDEIAQAKARLLAARANEKYASDDFDRLSQLRESRTVSADQYDQAFATLNAAEQTSLELKAAYDLAIDGPRPEQIAQSRARVAMQAANVNQIKDRIKKYTIISRFDGYVVEEFTEAGAWLRSGDPVVELAALDEVEVRGFVAEQHIAHVKPGTEVRVEVPSIEDRIFTGVVTMIVPQADMQARTFPVNVKVKNEITEAGPMLKAGMYARIELPTGKLQTAMMVPKDALVLGGPKPSVFVVDAGDDPSSKSGSVRPIPVELGVATDQLIQVKGPIEVGQWVVVEGNERLRPGQKVSVTSIANPPAIDAEIQDKEA